MGQSAVAVSEEVGQVSSWARLHRGVRHWLVISLDAANGFNSVSRAAIFRRVAEVLPSLLPFVEKLCGRDPLSLFFCMDGGPVETIPSRTGTQQGAPLGIVLFCIGTLAALRNLRAHPASGCAWDSRCRVHR